jgi:hypothetical protein
MTGTGIWNEFKSDLLTSLKAWTVAPLLPVISILFLFPYFLPVQSLAVQSPDETVNFPWWAYCIGLAYVLILAGWFGTERIWYLRIYRGHPISPIELLKFTCAFMGRFVRLALLIGVLAIPLEIIFWIVGWTNEPGNLEVSSSMVWTTAAVSVLIDFTLTFVTPAIVFSTRKAVEALKIGVLMLRTEWPQSAGYALVPSLALFVLVPVTSPDSLNSGVQMLIGVGCVLLNLWFKGATVAFYLRRHEVGDDGAAFGKSEADAIDLDAAPEPERHTS